MRFHRNAKLGLVGRFAIRCTTANPDDAGTDHPDPHHPMHEPSGNGDGLRRFQAANPPPSGFAAHAPGPHRPSGMHVESRDHGPGLPVRQWHW